MLHLAFSAPITITIHGRVSLKEVRERVEAFLNDIAGYCACTDEDVHIGQATCSDSYEDEEEEEAIATEYSGEWRYVGEHLNFFNFKDRKAFESGVGICYAVEETGRKYTRADFLELVGGDEERAEIVFDLCEWQHPGTLLDEEGK